MQLSSSLAVVLEETERRLAAVTRACDEYVGADFLQYAPQRRRGLDSEPLREVPPPLSNMQVFYVVERATETERARREGDAKATSDQLLAQLVKAVTAKRGVQARRWMHGDVDLTPVG